jgi:phosphate transport system ATP-binding protein
MSANLTTRTSKTEIMDKCTTKLGMKCVDFYYDDFRALKNITLDIPACAITAIIGPSGCGKSTLLRIFNRMNDLIPRTRAEGIIELDNASIYEKNTDVALLRKRVGMVFQKPNPFPMAVYDNVAFGPRQHGQNANKIGDIVEQSLRQAALWDEVKDKLKKSALTLTAGQQQLMCIARALAVGPEVILMDEPCSALDPTATLEIEELMKILAHDYTIIIVTHNMQQAARISDMAAFMMMDQDKAGVLAESGQTVQLFTNPKDKRTEDYISGRFG